MSGAKNTNSQIRILLSEGSSINVREVITAVGSLGYIIDICDPNPYNMGLFSFYIHKAYQCPKSGNDPVVYLKFVIKPIKEQGYDVLFPANEQAFLFVWAKEYLASLVGIAVSDFSSFQRLQTKSVFIRYLDEIELPHPPTRYVKTWDEIQEAVNFLGKPCYIKTDFGTTSTDIWRIKNNTDLYFLEESLNTQKILNGQAELIVQEASKVNFEQLYSIFDHGRIIAIHCTRRLKEGLGGGAIIKGGVDRPIVRQKSLKWLGSLSADYFYNELDGKAYYIDANPRITEPMNAMVNGINLAEMQVQLSVGEFIPTNYTGTINKSHSAIQALLAAASQRYSRFDILKEMCLVASKKGIHINSYDGATPVEKDFTSILPLSAVFLQLMINPKNNESQAEKTIANYSLGKAIPQISNMKPIEVLGGIIIE